MSSPAAKKKLSREILEDDGIYIADGIHEMEDLEKRIGSIRNMVVRQRKRLPYNWQRIFEKEYEEFQDDGYNNIEAFRDNWSLKPEGTEFEPAYFQKDELSHRRKRGVESQLAKFKAIARAAIQWRERREKETTWMSFLQQHFFIRFHTIYQDPTPHDQTIKRWELHENLEWNEFPWVSTPYTSPHRTKPKPDLTYAFPIIDTSTKVAKPYFTDTQVENFSLHVLGKLRTQNGLNLISAPTKKLNKWKENKSVEMNASEMICFPWAVVEAKPVTKNPTFCFCQAANASSAALTLQEDLMSQANDPTLSTDTLATFAFTCIGPSVKLWITSRQKTHEPIFMRCIWATSLELTWGAMALEMVIKNLHEWIYTRARPEISRWIGKVRQRPSMSTYLTPDGDKVVRSRRAGSHEPESRRPEFALPESPRATPRSKRAPVLPREKSDPESIRRPRSRFFSEVDPLPTIRQFKNLTIEAASDEDFSPSDDDEGDDEDEDSVEEAVFEDEDDFGDQEVVESVECEPSEGFIRGMKVHGMQSYLREFSSEEEEDDDDDDEKLQYSPIRSKKATPRRRRNA